VEWRATWSSILRRFTAIADGRRPKVILHLAVVHDTGRGFYRPNWLSFARLWIPLGLTASGPPALPVSQEATQFGAMQRSGLIRTIRCQLELPNPAMPSRVTGLTSLPTVCLD
jgi:hypothetical protein